MRTSILSRSVIAVASLAIGSVALAAAPANAASASGVTRDTILTAVNGARAAAADGNDNDYDWSPATSRALRDIAVRSCDVRTDEDEYVGLQTLQLMTAGDDADGILITAYVDRSFGGYNCTIAAFVAADGTSQLSGSAIITDEQYDEDLEDEKTVTLQTSALSGDAFVTAPLVNGDYYGFTATASGNATKTTDVTTSTKVATPKTTKQKKAAKKAQDKALKSAKKSYTKALKKAGDSKKKKAAAKKAYNKKKAAAKAKYKNAIVTFKIVTTTTKVLGESRPFSITTVPTQNVPTLR